VYVIANIIVNETWLFSVAVRNLVHKL